jgi:preprotein translocase subunit SecA
MINEFDDLSEQELIEILDEGSLSPEDLAEFTDAMQRKGLSGSIMTVNDPDSEEGRAAVEYIEYHKKIPSEHCKKMPKEKIEWAKNVLLSKDESLESKKEAILNLAHVGQIDAYKALEEYEKSPDPELKIWINMAIQECQGFLKSDILDKPVISFGKVTKRGRNEPCSCGSGKKFKKCCSIKNL